MSYAWISNVNKWVFWGFIDKTFSRNFPIAPEHSDITACKQETIHSVHKCSWHVIMLKLCFHSVHKCSWHVIMLKLCFSFLIASSLDKARKAINLECESTSRLSVHGWFFLWTWESCGFTYWEVRRDITSVLNNNIQVTIFRQSLKVLCISFQDFTRSPKADKTIS